MNEYEITISGRNNRERKTVKVKNPLGIAWMAKAIREMFNEED